jgi:hypothetical protein
MAHEINAHRENVQSAAVKMRICQVLSEERSEGAASSAFMVLFADNFWIYYRYNSITDDAALSPLAGIKMYSSICGKTIPVSRHQ